jgi:hypothetical protein
MKRNIKLFWRNKWQDAQIIIGKPLKRKKYWEINWRISILMPISHQITGDDEMEALLNCLAMISGFIENMGQQGTEMYYKSPGDFCSTLPCRPAAESKSCDTIGTGES